MRCLFVAMFIGSIVWSYAFPIWAADEEDVSVEEQEVEERENLRDRFIQPPLQVEIYDGYVEEVIEVEKPESHTVPQPFALLRGLDKISGRVTDLRAEVGIPITYERLTIRVDTCRASPPEESDDAFAFMQIQDSMTGEDIIYSGWMFSASPALSAMDHQRYDIWVLSCATS
ncbi:MAG: DUF2155 domain-containing protein [Pikeienuella sp.]